MDFSDDSAYMRSVCAGTGSDAIPPRGPGTGWLPGLEFAENALEEVGEVSEVVNYSSLTPQSLHRA